MISLKVHSTVTLKWVSLFFWMVLGQLRLLEAWHNTRLIPFLLAVESGTMIWLLFTRKEQAEDARWTCKIIAWISALLPLAMHLERETASGQAITTLGLSLVLWSMIILGRSFGIAPADRGLVHRGPYRYIRHPMYLGELVSICGGLLGNLSAWNVILIAVLFLSLLYRIQREELVIHGYSCYAGQVRWRLIPKVW